MPPLQPLKQTIFETGPKVPSSSPLQPIKYAEDPTEIPNPINIQQAIDPGIAWQQLGANAMKMASELTEQYSDYLAQKVDADIEDVYYDAEQKILEQYTAAANNNFAGQTGVTSDSMVSSIQAIEENTKKKVIALTGVSDLFEESFNNEGVGSRWLPVFNTARKGMAQLASVSERVQRDAHLTGSKQRESASELAQYQKWGKKIEEDVFSMIDTQPVGPQENPLSRLWQRRSANLELTPAEQESGVRLYAENAIPSNVTGPIHASAVSQIRPLLGATLDGVTENDLQVGIALLQRASDAQLSQLSLTEAEFIRIGGIRAISGGYSVSETSKILREMPDISFVPSLLLVPANQRQKFGTKTQEETAAGVVTAAVAAVTARWGTYDAGGHFPLATGGTWKDLLWDQARISYYNLTGNPVEAGRIAAQSGLDFEARAQADALLPTQEDILASPYMRAAIYGAIGLALSHPNADHSKLLDNYFKHTLTSGKIYRTPTGGFEYVNFEPILAESTMNDLVRFNRYKIGDVKALLTPELLVARTQLALPYDAGSIFKTTDSHLNSMERQLHLSHTFVPRNHLMEMILGIRNKATNDLGADYLEGASEAQILQYVLITSDEVIRHYNGGRDPTSETELRTAIREAFKDIPTADYWGVTLIPNNGHLEVGFTNIPMNAHTKNLLTEKHITPNFELFSGGFTPRSMDGAAASIRVGNTLRDANGTTDLLLDQTEAHAYLEKLKTGQSSHTRGRSSVTTNNPDLQQYAADYLDSTIDRVDMDRRVVNPLSPPLSPTLETIGNFTDLPEWKTILQDVAKNSPEILGQLQTVLRNPTASVTQANTNEFLRSEGTLAVLGAYVQRRYGITKEQATKTLRTLFNSTVGDRDFNWVMWERHRDRPMAYMVADIISLLDGYFDPRTRTKDDYFSTPSANTMANLRGNPVEVSTQFTKPWDPYSSLLGFGPGGPLGDSGQISSTKGSKSDFLFGSGGSSISRYGGENSRATRKMLEKWWQKQGGAEWLDAGALNLTPAEEAARYNMISNPGPTDVGYGGQVLLREIPDPFWDPNGVLGSAPLPLTQYGPWKNEAVFVPPSSIGNAAKDGLDKKAPQARTTVDLKLPPGVPPPAKLLEFYYYDQADDTWKPYKATQEGISPGAVGSPHDRPDVEPPTITVLDRKTFPPIYNKGRVSTVLTLSFQETQDGPYILIPGTFNGKIFGSAKEAIQHYYSTGRKHFGIFSSLEKANAHAKLLHDQETVRIAHDSNLWMSVLTDREGLDLTAKKDSTGRWTIGKGSTWHPDGTPVKEGDTITPEQVKPYVEDYVYRVVIPALSSSIPSWHEMTVGQQAALISFGYNIGPFFYGKPDRKEITHALSSKENWHLVPSILRKYTKAKDEKTGKMVSLRGLETRREQEIALWEGKQPPPKLSFSVVLSPPPEQLLRTSLVEDPYLTAGVLEKTGSSTLADVYAGIYGPVLGKIMLDEAAARQKKQGEALKKLEEYWETHDRAQMTKEDKRAELEKSPSHYFVMPDYDLRDESVTLYQYNDDGALVPQMDDPRDVPPDAATWTGTQPHIIFFGAHPALLLGEVGAHEMTHVGQKGKDLPDPLATKSFIALATPELNAEFSIMKAISPDKAEESMLYTLNPKEIPAWLVTMKTKYFQDTGIALRANGTKEEYERFYFWIKTDLINKESTKESRINKPFVGFLYRCLTSPNAILQQLMEETLRQVALDPRISQPQFLNSNVRPSAIADARRKTEKALGKQPAPGQPDYDNWTSFYNTTLETLYSGGLYA